MRNRMISFLCFLIMLTACSKPPVPEQAVHADYSIKIINTDNVNYEDYAFYNEMIWAINRDGRLAVWNGASDQLEKREYSLNGLTSVNVTRDGMYVGDEAGKIYRYDGSKDRFEEILKTGKKKKVYGVYITAGNKKYAVVDTGIIDLVSHKRYRPEGSSNSQLREGRLLGKPSAVFLDSRNNIWLGYNYGEWGGDVHVFHTATNKFLPVSISPDRRIKKALKEIDVSMIEISPVNSFFEADGIVYLTAGLDHFDLSGSIIEFKRDRKRMKGKPVLFKSSFGQDTGEFIGPGTFNPSNKSIYYYSNMGFMYSEGSAINEKTQWHVLFSPRLTWRGDSDSVGFSMNVKKLEFIDAQTLVFNTESDGIAIFNGTLLTFLR